MRLKRALDVVVGITALIFSAPLQALVAMMVRQRLGRPVLFRQPRVGLDGEVFELVKFRTMLPADPEVGLVDDADRLTRFGQWLRSTSLDELPTLWNVVRGDMSLVGPRPLLVEYLELYTSEQARRHEVRPGLTGLAQVAGRNAVDWDERLRLDVEYVDAHSLRGDLALISRTVAMVLSRRGTSAPGEATMSRFVGSTRSGEPL